MAAAGMVPNLLAVVFNIAYYRAEILADWPAAAVLFDLLGQESGLLAINCGFQPLGVLIFALPLLPILRGLARLRAGQRLPSSEAARLRRRCLHLGRLAALICVGSWLVVGIAWPAAVRIVSGPPPQGAVVYLHFAVSLVLCGLIAAVYPYFIMTFMSLRVLYPAFLDPDRPAGEDAPALAQLAHELGLFRVLATAVPLFAVALIAWRGASSPFAVAVLSITGLVGTALVYALESRIRADLAALAEVPP
jgi:hypothetical protein